MDHNYSAALKDIEYFSVVDGVVDVFVFVGRSAQPGPGALEDVRVGVGQHGSKAVRRTTDAAIYLIISVAVACNSTYNIYTGAQ